MQRQITQQCRGGGRRGESGGLITAHDWFLYSLLKLEMHGIHSSQSNLKAEWNTLLVQCELFFWGGGVMSCFSLNCSFFTVKTSFITSELMIVVHNIPARQPCSNYSTKGRCGCRFSFQPSSSTPDLTHLINWSQSSESWLVKLCALDWLEQKPALDSL